MKLLLTANVSLILLALLTLASGGRMFQKIREHIQNLKGRTTTTESSWTTTEATIISTTTAATTVQLTAGSTTTQRADITTTSSKIETFTSTTAIPESVTTSSTSTPISKIKQDPDPDCWWTTCDHRCPGPAVIKGSSPCSDGTKVQFNCCTGLL